MRVTVDEHGSTVAGATEASPRAELRRLHSIAAGARFRVVEPLRERDVKGLLGVLHEASEVEGPEVFTESVVDAFTKLIPSDSGAACNTYFGLDPTVRPAARSQLSFSEIDCEWCIPIAGLEWTEELDTICRQYIEHQDPHPPVPAFIHRAVRRSDLIRRSYRKTELWNLVERRVGAKDALCLWLDVPGDSFLRRILLVTARRTGFGDRDLQMLELLTPHLLRLYSRAASRRKIPPGLEMLTPREREVLGLVAAGRTNREVARYLWISPHTVRAHLEHVFEK